MVQLITAALIAAAVIIVIFKTARIVPQKQAWIVERLGKYHSTLSAGLHILMPFVDRVAYKRDLKEVAIDVPPQQCVTRDNIIVEVDGLLYLQIVDPIKASYGISDYLFACSQLAQTTLRSEVGKLELDRTFEERATINGAICAEVDKASDPWGVKVTRYEIKTIKPPLSVLDAMEKQMRAEREKRAQIAESEGERQSRINRAEGEKCEAIAHSEGENKNVSTKLKAAPKRSASSPKLPPTVSPPSPAPSAAKAAAMQSIFSSPKNISPNSANSPKPITP